MDIIKLTHEKLSVDDALESVTASNCGAVSLFVGTTRDNFEDKKVVRLEYEAYEPMAEKAMKQICNDIRIKWPSLENLAIFHRLGIVPVKQSSVIIAISSPHRADALQATQFCIDTLKKSVPIWKKEIYNETESQWKENSECVWSNTNKDNKESFEIKTNVACPKFSSHLAQINCSNEEIQKRVDTNIDKKPFTPKRNVNCPKYSSHMVQVNCSNEEIQRRINAFVHRKREQVNLTNIRDFCGGITNNPFSCARVDAVLIRQKNSKSHLRVQRIYNTYGPYNINKTAEQPYISDAVEQRMSEVENDLDIKPVSRDVYQRLKQIEDRILYLESVSPEYAHFWNKNYSQFGTNSTDLNVENSSKKRKFSMKDVDGFLLKLQKEVQEKLVSKI